MHDSPSTLWEIISFLAPGGVWSQVWNLKELTEGHHQEWSLRLKVFRIGPQKWYEVTIFCTASWHCRQSLVREVRNPQKNLEPLFLVVFGVPKRDTHTKTLNREMSFEVLLTEEYNCLCYTTLRMTDPKSLWWFCNAARQPGTGNTWAFEASWAWVDPVVSSPLCVCVGSSPPHWLWWWNTQGGGGTIVTRGKVSAALFRERWGGLLKGRANPTCKGVLLLEHLQLQR